MSEVKEKFAENSAFWADYQAAARSRGIAANRVKWYEHWCRQFEKFMRGAPLAEATSEQVDAFLGNMEQNPAIQQWQLTQATDALKVLFADHLHHGWAKDGMLSKNRQSISQAINVSGQSESPALRLSPEQAELIGRLTGELRVRQYSRRTVDAYCGWVSRYLWGRDWRWQFVFPSSQLAVDPDRSDCRKRFAYSGLHPGPPPSPPLPKGGNPCRRALRRGAVLDRRRKSV